MTVVLAGAVTLSLAACGDSTSASVSTETTSVSVEEKTEVQENSISFSDESFTDNEFNLMVSAVNDNVISGSIMTMGGDMQAPGENDGDMQQPGGESVPDKPDGENNDSRPGGDMQMPENNGEDMQQPGENGGEIQAEAVTVTITLNDISVLNGISLSDIAEGSFLTITLNDDGTLKTISLSEGGFGGGEMGNGGGSVGSGVDSYTAVNEYTEDTVISGESFVSTGTDENAILVSSGNVTLNDVDITRNSNDSTGGDNSSFYGVGAAALVTDGTLTIDGATITTDSKGGAGVFAYGNGTAYVSDSTISTTESTSGGIHVAGGGTLYAENLTVTTQGESAAAIRSDRGGGTMTVDGGSYTSNGTGSPSVYCTADITVSNAELTANGSEAVCIEGLNSLKLYNCDLTGNMADNSQNDCTWNIIVYQSMSGDSEVGNGVFAMNVGSITAENGGMFYTTNTESTIYLKNVTLNYSDSNEFLLQCTGNTNARGWGSSGKNGADCVFTADSQTLAGRVIYDSISTLDFYLENGSSFTGTFTDDETWAGAGGNGCANLCIDAASTWTVTEDAVLTNLYNAGSIVDANGRTVSIVGTDGTVFVSGESDVTVTVSSYSTSVDLSGAYSMN